jgi:aspartate racemase
MKTIGLLGGMSWESTQIYYRLINEGVRESLGGLHSAEIAMVSIDFHEVEALMRSGAWREIGNYLLERARKVEAAGADFLLVCTNTMHKLASLLEASLSIPLLHIADAAGESIQRQGLNQVALLGTRFTMEEDFYRKRLEERYGLQVLVPPDSDRKIIDRIIFEELCRGEVRGESKEQYLRIIEALREEGAEGIIEGCTEIPMLISPQDTPLPLFDTTALHAAAAVQLALAGEST